MSAANAIRVLAAGIIALGSWYVVPAIAQDKAPAPPKKKPAVKLVAHKKATPEQIRRFNELEKKKSRETKK